MLTENDEPGVSHQTGASNSQPGDNFQPEIVHPAEAGLSSQPGETLAKTLSDININMGTMASLLKTIVARQDAKPQKKKNGAIAPMIFRAPTPSLKTTTTRRQLNESAKKMH